MNYSGNTTEQECSQTLTVGHAVALIAINSLSSIVGTVGNILVCLAVIVNSRSQRNTSTYLLFSLAIADLVVTMFSQPTVVAMLIKRVFFHQCAKLLEQLYSVSSYISCSASIMHLAAISIDRAGAVLRPMKHIVFMGTTGWKIYIGISWTTAAIYALTGQIFKGTKAARYVAASLFFASYIIIVVCYSLILIRLRKERRKWSKYSERKHTSTTKVENRVATTVAIVIAIFTASWVPMIIAFFAKGEPLVAVNGPAFMWIRTLALCNSSMNFIIYTWRLREFRQAYWRIIRCKTLKQESRSSDVTMANY